ncbi:MAG: Bacterial rane flanked domain protein, partial [Nocardioides sp.]|nr:Bacterial rane flanked domain protein [Nocardioides sp.]
AVAADRVAGLGHALADGHLVSRSGSLVRRREILDVGHVIGWNLRATWFQRRAGLTTLVATTAGGGGSVAVLDVPEAEAVRVADQAIPGLVSQFASGGSRDGC